MFSTALQFLQWPLRLLLLSTPANASTWANALIWLARLVTLALLARTYVAPTLVGLVTRRVRIRSISLRSVRGLYLRTGDAVINAERIRLGWRWVSGAKTVRITVTVTGLQVDLLERRAPARRPSRPLDGHARMPSLAQLRPSPIASYTWAQLPSFASIFRYFIRPALTAAARAVLRLLILALPSLTQVLELEFDQTAISSSAHMGLTLVLGRAVLSSHLAFVQQAPTSEDKVAPPASPTSGKSRKETLKAYWEFVTTQSREHAWASTQAVANISFRMEDVTASIAQPETQHQLMYGLPKRQALLRLPKGIGLRAGVGFFPAGLRIKEESLEAALDVGQVSVSMEQLSALLAHVKAAKAERESTELEEPMSPSDGETTPSLSLRIPTTPMGSPYIMSPTGVTSPTSLMSPLSPASPTASPRRLRSMDPFSAFRRAARKARPLPPKKTSKPWLSYLLQLSVSISDVSVVGSSPFPFEASIDAFALSCGTSEPGPGTQHREALGKSTATPAAPAYTMSLSIRQANLARRERTAEVGAHSTPILHLGTTSLTCFTSDWPRALLSRVAHSTQDPNDALLAVRLLVDRIEATERLDLLQAMLDARTPKTVDPTTLPTKSSPVPALPRLQLEFHVAEICGILACTRAGEEWAGLTMGLTIPAVTLRASTYFTTPSTPKSAAKGGDQPTTDAQLQMDFDASINTDHITIVVLSGGISTHGSATPGHGDKSEPFMLMDPLELSAHGTVQGQPSDGDNGGVSIDLATALVDVLCATDALSVELWHDDVIEAVTMLRTLTAPSSPEPKPLTPPKRPWDRVPFGIVAKLGVRRLTVFVTSPDLNPNDDMQLARGVALRTSASLSYAAVKQTCLPHLPSPLQRSQQRQKLSLPEERLVNASAAARTAAVTNQEGAFAQLALRHITVRAAFATPFAADDPYFEHEDYAHSQLLHVPLLVADITFRTQRTIVGVPDICGINVQVPDVVSTLRLSDMYSMLLASRRLQALSTPSAAKKKAAPKAGTMSVTVAVSLDSVQALLRLPLKQAICLRGHGFHYNIPSSGPKVFRAGELVCFVPGRDSDQWQDFIRVKNGSVQLAQGLKTPLKVTVDGAVRVRIPHGFVLNELVRSISISLKSLRHLVRVVQAGRHFPIAEPAPEEAKKVPHVEFRLRVFVFEADDDPLEARLGLIWRAGTAAARIRMERDDAFTAKAQAIYAQEGGRDSAENVTSHTADYRFDAKHSVPISDARERLMQVHALDWMARIKQQRETREEMEATLCREIWGDDAAAEGLEFEPLVAVAPAGTVPPLLRLMAQGVHLTLSAPSFPVASLPDFLFVHGAGIPRDTAYSLLVPLHLQIALSSARLAIRDYPLPLFNIPQNQDAQLPSLEFDTDLVIAEEMGGPASVDWVNCDIVESDNGVQEASPLSVCVPKTIMPVKTYATPVIRMRGGGIADFAWGISYQAVTQDLTRVIDTIGSPPRDSSPPVGFWDKLRLQMHWKVQVIFDKTAEVHMHMKGSRDPYEVNGNGAGFVVCWSGNPRLRIGYDNPEKELMQIESDEMLFAIPDLEAYNPRISHERDDISIASYRVASRKYRKICAKLGGGTKYGIGVKLERACGSECADCSGTAFHRGCRYFNFIPHYKVQLGRKDKPPTVKSPEDSYNGFRSDYLHMSISISSSLHKASRQPSYSSFHLSPQMFSHFWAWSALFDRTMSLPIRQGKLWPSKSKAASPKLGRHIATIKYRVAVPNLFVSHVYVDDSQDAWGDGSTPIVGLKARIDCFQADLHQREEESLVPGLTPGSLRVIRRKPFHTAEVVMKRLDLRVVLANFEDPLKQSVPMDAFTHSSNYRNHPDMPKTDGDSEWVDFDDFVDVGWAPSELKDIHVLPAAFCPRFSYFKHEKNADDLRRRSRSETSKFGDEDSHVCFMGKDATVSQVQIELALARIQALRKNLAAQGKRRKGPGSAAEDARQISLLEAYVAQLRKEEDDDDDDRHSYYMPAHAVRPEEWADFDNVYQVHNPEIYMSNAVRDILFQYYYCSRATRGFEYHMATRAVKFIRDQAEVLLASTEVEKKPSFGGILNAHHAANAFKRMLNPNPRISVLMANDKRDARQQAASSDMDPLDGWSDGVSLTKSHFCLLLKPQIVMQSDVSDSSVCVLAAVQATARAYAIMDDANADDPVSGKIMTRSYTAISGLQMFSPSSTNTSSDRCVPLEIFVDLRCESQDFDRVVPQTDAAFHYDKFNRLRLRNKKESVLPTGTDSTHSHLQHQTDLIRVDVPHFSVGATDSHLQSISDVLTKLVLFSDAAHKARAEKLEKMLFSYDFTDLLAAANVISDLQGRLRHVVEAERLQQTHLLEQGDNGKLELLKLKARALSLSEELNLIFDAIKLAQDKADDNGDRKSALMLRATSDEIAWRMLDKESGLLAKLAVRKVEFSWLSRTDSTTISRITLGDLRAENPDPQAIWAEILSKTDGQAHHYISERNLFLYTEWKLIAPVGGISIYEYFHVILHPMRLQIETRMGSRLMEYVWPERRRRKQSGSSPGTPTTSRNRRMTEAIVEPRTPAPGGRASMETPRSTDHGGRSFDQTRLVPPQLRRKGTSRSFTDLRSASRDQQHERDVAPEFARAFSSYAFPPAATPAGEWPGAQSSSALDKDKARGEADEMKSRSVQKSFVDVRVESLNLLLSVWKANSFACQDARIQTRVLQYKNRTCSLEELVEQFIPSNSGWTGWVKMALHQPLVPVFPVARELFSKTKLIARKGGQMIDAQAHGEAPPRRSTHFSRKATRMNEGTPGTLDLTGTGADITRTTSPEPLDGRNRMMRFLKKGKRKNDSLEAIASITTSSSTSSDLISDASSSRRSA